MSLSPDVRHSGEALGRPSRNAATAALNAHLEVIKGEPLRLSLSNALRDQKNLGGQERRFAALCTRELSRHMRVLDLAAKLLGHPPSDWALKEDQVLIRYVLWRRLFTDGTPQKILAEAKLPGPIRPRSIKDSVLETLINGELAAPELPADPVERAATVHSFPGWLATRLSERVPAEEIDALLGALNTEPSLVLRARPPGSRDAVIAALAEEGVEAVALSQQPDALRITDVGNRIFETKVMKSGRLQVMDLGSQLIAALCAPSRESQVADVCAGAGGKSLMLADHARQVFAGDISKRRLQDARERAKELKIRNIGFPAELPLGEVDIALIDAPCSGIGTLSREPDQKWKLNPKAVAEFTEKQTAILAQTAAAIRPGAALIYATCSLLREEDEAVVESFLASHPEFELQPAEGFVAADACVNGYLLALPHRVPGGGFFAARLLRKADAWTLPKSSVASHLV